MSLNLVCVIVVADGMSTDRRAKVSVRLHRRLRELEGVEHTGLVAENNGTDVDCGVG